MESNSDMKEERSTNMNYYEILVSWKTPDGVQLAWAYCNAKSKQDATGKIKMNVPFTIEISDEINCYPHNSKLADDKVKLWYFTGNKLYGTEKEHTEVY